VLSAPSCVVVSALVCVVVNSAINVAVKSASCDEPIACRSAVVMPGSCVEDSAAICVELNTLNCAEVRAAICDVVSASISAVASASIAEVGRSVISVVVSHVTRDVMARHLRPFKGEASTPAPIKGRAAMRHGLDTADGYQPGAK
jgi:hypothetical protein